MSEPVPTLPKSFLDLVEVCDNFSIPSRGPRPFGDEELVPWHLTPDPSSPVIGLIRPSILEQLRKENPQIWHFSQRDNGKLMLAFASAINTPAKRSGVMKELCERWRDDGLWPSQIGPKKWRGEMYPVYRNPFGKHDAPTVEEGDSDLDEGTTNYAFMMERAASALFGVVTYGVHMTIYLDYSAPDGGSRNPDTRSCRIWVPKRAWTKQTWPGYLDNSVAGGIPTGYGAFESLVKESMEEASIPEDFVRKHGKAVGVASYFYRTDAGWLQPEVEYLYELYVPPDSTIQPKPLDGEVESFECLPLAEIKPKMAAGLFKPNCAIVLIDFMIRHGYITPDNEPDFLEISTRLHGRFDYERW